MLYCYKMYIGIPWNKQELGHHWYKPEFKGLVFNNWPTNKNINFSPRTKEQF